MRHRRLFEAAAVAVSLGACAQPGAPPVCTAPLKPAAFLADTVTPRFPDGLSVLNVEGQAGEPQSGSQSGRIVRERTKLLVIVVFDAPAHRGRVREIVEAYNSRFGQHSALMFFLSALVRQLLRELIGL